MRKFKLLLAVIFVSLGLQAAVADDAVEAARAAKRTSAGVTTGIATRQRSDNATNAPAASASARTTAARDGNVVTTSTSRTTTTTPASPAPRTGNIGSRATVNTGQTVATRTNATTSRNAIPTKNSSRASAATRTGAVSRSATTGAMRTSANASRAAISANTARAGVTASDIINKDYKKCREVFYGCMDEFCANKDTSLKRCACSARIHDFDSVKKQLTNVEDKMLNFNERLLTVNMEKEDALAISAATEGELAFQQTDNSDSKKILDEISKKLKTGTVAANTAGNMNAISLSLNADSAWDNIDSLMGASSTTKEGTALYNAALPICREMVAEICDGEGASLAESGYLMTIEQDCNTVSKAYATLQDQAVEKVREGSALLDISRLDIHQKRNSDDILTCKKKMLDKMYEEAVCGTDLGKCLDTTGKYIDPSTGEAFLTVDLANLGSLITRPSGSEKWTTAPGNNIFVTFLNSKKNYLESAMENCQDISDQVWNDFIEDALAQIKLAQESKLETMRQSCTSLTTQCLSDTAKSIADFDARALSTFGVSADKTVNEMCDSIKTACTALLESTGADTDWVGGMTQIATDKTFDTIVQTCREVGKACIIQTCKSVSGNFGLCESIEYSVNRKSVINRSACWNEVVDCVKAAGDDAITRIMDGFGGPGTDSDSYFYNRLYGQTIRINNDANGNDACDPLTGGADENCIYDICTNCAATGDCSACRIAESIWGNCERAETVQTSDTVQNMIKEPIVANDTLLWWFAKNTGTETRFDSCKDTSCPSGWVLASSSNTDGVIRCRDKNTLSDEGLVCSEEERFYISQSSNWTNCFDRTNQFDSYDNRCENGGVTIYANPSSTYFGTPPGGSINVCGGTGSPTVTPVAVFPGATGDTYYDPDNNILLCVAGTLSYTDTGVDDFPGGKTVNCNGGSYIVINTGAGTYISPQFIDADQKPTYPQNYYLGTAQIKCVFNSEDKTWGTMDSGGNWSVNAECNAIVAPPVNDDNNLFITY